MSEGRYELKYAVPVARRDALLRLAWDHVKPDTNADNLVEVLPDLRDPDGEPPFGYRVCSLYVDDAHLDGYAQRLDSRRIRNRLRIRSYGWNGTTAPVFFEAKRKLDDQVIKHRVKVCSTATWATLPGRHPWREAADTTTPKAAVLAQRWVQAVDRGRMGVVCRVDYLRETFVCGTARLTLDHRVSADGSDDPHDLRGHCPVQLIPEDWMVLELKFNGQKPVWMRKLARELHLVAEPVSKFALGVALTRRAGRVSERRHLTPPSIRRAERLAEAAR